MSKCRTGQLKDVYAPVMTSARKANASKEYRHSVGKIDLDQFNLVPKMVSAAQLSVMAGHVSHHSMESGAAALMAASSAR